MVKICLLRKNWNYFMEFLYSKFEYWQNLKTERLWQLNKTWNSQLSVMSRRPMVLTLSASVRANIGMVISNHKLTRRVLSRQAILTTAGIIICIMLPKCEDVIIYGFVVVFIKGLTSWLSTSRMYMFIEASDTFQWKSMF